MAEDDADLIRADRQHRLVVAEAARNEIQVTLITVELGTLVSVQDVFQHHGVQVERAPDLGHHLRVMQTVKVQPQRFLAAAMQVQLGQLVCMFLGQLRAVVARK